MADDHPRQTELVDSGRQHAVGKGPRPGRGLAQIARLGIAERGVGNLKLRILDQSCGGMCTDHLQTRCGNLSSFRGIDASAPLRRRADRTHTADGHPGKDRLGILGANVHRGIKNLGDSGASKRGIGP